MIGPFDYHVFAHVNGRYQTAYSSPGISAPEKVTLEQFFFGQTNDDAYLASLDGDPGLVWRQCNERYALTRVLRGQKDTNGRATLAFASLLIPVHDVKRVVSHLAEIAISTWEKTTDRAALGQLRPAPSAALHPDTISQAILAVDAKRRFVCAVGDVTLRDVQMIVEKCHDKADFSLCYKSLNEQAPTMVNLVSDSKHRPTTAQAVRSRTATHGAQLPRRPSTAPARGGTGPTILLAVLALLNTALLAYIALSLPASTTGGNELQNNISNRVEGVKQALAADLAAMRTTDLRSIQSKVSSLEQQVKAAQEEVDSRIHEIDNRLETVQNNLADEHFADNAGFSKTLQPLHDKLDGLSSVIDRLQKLEAQLDKLQPKTITGRVVELDTRVTQLEDALQRARQPLEMLKVAIDKLVDEQAHSKREALSNEDAIPAIEELSQCLTVADAKPGGGGDDEEPEGPR